MATWTALLVMFSARTTRTRVLAGSLAVAGGVLAAVARADSGLFAGMLAVAVAILCWRSLWKSKWQVVAPLIIAVVGVSMFLGAGQCGILSAGFAAPTPGRDGVGPVFWNLLNLPGLYASPIGTWGLGWLDTSLPSVTSVATIAAIGGVVALALPQMGKVEGVVMSGLLGIMVVLPLYLLNKSPNIVGENLQARYLLPLLTFAIGLLVLIAVKRTGFLGGRRVRFAMAVGLALAQTGSLNWEIRRYVVGEEYMGFDLDNVTEWWRDGWPSPMTTWFLGSAAFFLLALLILNPLRPRRPDLAAVTLGNEARMPAEGSAVDSAEHAPNGAPGRVMDEPDRARDD